MYIYVCIYICIYMYGCMYVYSIYACMYVRSIYIDGSRPMRGGTQQPSPRAQSIRDRCFSTPNTWLAHARRTATLPPAAPPPPPAASLPPQPPRSARSRSRSPGGRARRQGRRATAARAPVARRPSRRHRPPHGRSPNNRQLRLLSTGAGRRGRLGPQPQPHPKPRERGPRKSGRRVGHRTQACASVAQARVNMRGLQRPQGERGAGSHAPSMGEEG